MKRLSTAVFLTAALTCAAAVFAQANSPSGEPRTAAASGCSGCSQQARTAGDSSGVAPSQPIPGSNENMLVGRIENLIPTGVLAVLGCEKCAEEAVGWALQQGSSFEDVDRALRTVAAMQTLECFQRQFGPEVVSRMARPLAAANNALQQAKHRAGR